MPPCQCLSFLVVVANVLRTPFIKPTIGVGVGVPGVHADRLAEAVNVECVVPLQHAGGRHSCDRAVRRRRHRGHRLRVDVRKEGLENGIAFGRGPTQINTASMVAIAQCMAAGAAALPSCRCTEASLGSEVVHTRFRDVEMGIEVGPGGTAAEAGAMLNDTAGGRGRGPRQAISLWAPAAARACAVGCQCSTG